MAMADRGNENEKGVLEKIFKGVLIDKSGVKNFKLCQ
jgi:hypothetical protein